MKVDFILGDFPFNLLVPFTSTPTSKILPWNKWMENYNNFLFIFSNKVFVNDGAILSVDPHDLHIFKEVQSCLDIYEFKIRMKWVMVHSLPLVSNEDSTIHIWYFCISTNLFFYYFLISFHSIVQTLLNKVLFLVRSPLKNPKLFCFLNPLDELVKNGFNIPKKHVIIYNWINKSLVTKS